MPRDHSTNIFGGWERYRVKLVERIEPTEAPGKPRVEVTLERESRTFRCSGCGQETTKVHETVVRCIRDLPMLDAETHVWVPRYQVACPTCGPKLESLPWLSPWERVTKRLAESVVRLCRVLPVQHSGRVLRARLGHGEKPGRGALADQLLPWTCPA